VFLPFGVLKEEVSFREFVAIFREDGFLRGFGVILEWELRIILGW
jgi:hypothetical protein